MSGLSGEERKKYGKIIQQLGGIYFDIKVFTYLMFSKGMERITNEELWSVLGELIFQALDFLHYHDYFTMFTSNRYALLLILSTTFVPVLDLIYYFPL